MTRTQTLLLLALVLVTALVVGRFSAAFLAQALAAAEAVPALVRSVPGWVWWTAFGVAMSLKCVLKPAWSGGCCRASRAAPERPSAPAA